MKESRTETYTHIWTHTDFPQCPSLSSREQAYRRKSLAHNLCALSGFPPGFASQRTAKHHDSTQLTWPLHSGPTVCLWANVCVCAFMTALYPVCMYYYNISLYVSQEPLLKSCIWFVCIELPDEVQSFSCFCSPDSNNSESVSWGNSMSENRGGAMRKWSSSAERRRGGMQRENRFIHLFYILNRYRYVDRQGDATAMCNLMTQTLKLMSRILKL